MPGAGVLRRASTGRGVSPHAERRPGARLMRWITHLGGARATIGAGVVLLPFGGATARLGLAVLLANAISHATVQVLKRTVERNRPCDPNGRLLAAIDLPDP